MEIKKRFTAKNIGLWLLIPGIGIFIYSKISKKIRSSNDFYLEGMNEEQKRSGEEGVGSETPKLFWVEKVQFSDLIDGLVGTVKGDTVQMTFGGQQEEKIIAVHCQVGDVVNKGKILFEMDHVRARSKMKQVEINLNRVKDLSSVGGGTIQDVQEAQASYDIARKDYEDTFIVAPKHGTISEVNKRVGETVTRNDTVAVLVSGQDKFYIETGVIESQIDKVEKGQGVEIEIDALGSEKIKGTVQGISREVTMTGRTGTVLINLPSQIQKKVRPGLSAKCKIFISTRMTLVIPQGSYQSNEKSVYKLKSDGKVYKHAVTIGAVNRDYIEVVDGLVPGDKIVSDLVAAPVEDGNKVQDSGQYDSYKSSGSISSSFLSSQKN